MEHCIFLLFSDQALDHLSLQKRQIVNREKMLRKIGSDLQNHFHSHHIDTPAQSLSVKETWDVYLHPC